AQRDPRLHRRPRRRRRRLARLLRRRELALRHLPRPLRRRGRRPPPADPLRAGRHPHHLVHPRPHRRDLPRPDEGRRRRRPRDRPPRLFPREPAGDDRRAGAGRPREVHRPRDGVGRQAAARLRRALVGALRGDRRPPPGARHRVRQLPDERRLHPLLRPGRRPLDPHRLRPARRNLDAPAGPRRGDRPRRDRRQLVPGRPAADALHQGRPELPRLRQPARHRTPVARPVRLGLPRAGLRRLPADDPPGRLRPPPGAPDAGAPDRLHREPPGGPLGDVRGGRRRLPATPPAARRSGVARGRPI
ncbi:MAG: Putative polysaccharide deacetylase, partial [uncultured Thermomicrobiales bacterium]